MTNPTPHGQVPEALQLADEISKAGAFPAYPRAPYEAAAAELRRLRTRIAELEAQLEAIGAGGVSGPLVGSASLSAQAEGWQSIETAPKEGVFLVFMQDEVRPARRMQVANWHPNVKIVGGLFAFDCAKITHWMPLPPPPTSAEGVDHG